MKALARISVLVLIVLLSTVGLSYAQSPAEQHWTKGVEYGAKGKFEGAKKEFKKALEADPFYGRAEAALKIIEDVSDKKIKDKTAIHLFKGEANRNEEWWDEAIAEYDKAIKLDPKYAKAYYSRGITYYFKEEYDKAWEDIHKAQGLGFQVDPRFLRELREVSGRGK